MLFNPRTFIGIDPTAGQKPFSYAALDHELRPVALGEGRLEDILAYAAGQRQAWVAVCSPRRPNLGVMARQEVRQSLSPLPASGRWVDFRLADYILRQHHITIPQTPSRLEECPGWMQMGFNVFNGLDRLGYHPYPVEEADLQSLEVYPFASYSALLEVLPFSKYTLEGRLQRQLALYERKLKVADPMLIFEEFTRFKLLRGILPLEQLLKPGELDALVAAYTAWLAATHPDQVSLIGDPTEGQITLPVAELKAHYSN
ncbi:MAG: DUF429 domain-containing protein [Anaerolineales bacterium]|jgi:hypothetical protein|nr:DUF429 domain-containing protein [Anaerolineales bacterium]